MRLTSVMFPKKSIRLLRSLKVEALDSEEGNDIHGEWWIV